MKQYKNIAGIKQFDRRPCLNTPKINQKEYGKLFKKNFIYFLFLFKF